MKSKWRWVVIIGLIYLFILTGDVTSVVFEARSSLDPAWGLNLRGVDRIFYGLIPKYWAVFSISLFPILSSVLIASVGALFYSIKKGAPHRQGALLRGAVAFVLAAVPPVLVEMNRGLATHPEWIPFGFVFIYFIPFVLAVILTKYLTKKVTEPRYSERFKSEAKFSSVKSFFVLLIFLQMAYFLIGTAFPIGAGTWAQTAWGKKEVEQEKAAQLSMEIKVLDFHLTKPTGLYPDPVPTKTEYKEPTSRIWLYPTADYNRKYTVIIDWATKGKSEDWKRPIGSNSYNMWYKTFNAKNLKEAAHAYRKSVKENWANSRIEEEKFNLSETIVKNIPGVLVEIQGTRKYARCAIFLKGDILYSVSTDEYISPEQDFQEQITRIQQEMDDVLNSFRLKD